MSDVRGFEAKVTGRVQGVGFREATRREAERLGVGGWVRNQDDGSVAVRAEGPADAVGRFEAFLREGPRGASVDTVEVTDVDVSGGSGRFDVRG